MSQRFQYLFGIHYREAETMAFGVVPNQFVRVSSWIAGQTSSSLAFAVRKSCSYASKWGHCTVIPKCARMLLTVCSLTSTSNSDFNNSRIIPCVHKASCKSNCNGFILISSRERSACSSEDFRGRPWIGRVASAASSPASYFANQS